MKSLAALVFSALISISLAQPQEPFTIRISFGHGEEPRNWNGSLSLEGASIFDLEGWHFLAPDRLSLNLFQLRAGGEVPKGIVARGVSGPTGRITVTTNRGNFSFQIADLQAGREVSSLNGTARVERLLDAVKLTDDSRDDDYPSIAVVDENTAWAVWQSYSGRFDEIHVRKFQDGFWKTFTRVPNVSGDVWRPQIAVDAQGRPWVVWSQQVSGNFDVYARAYDEKENRWLKPVRLSSHPNPDVDHHLISDRQKNLWLVWQGFRGENSDILLRYYNGSEWSAEIRVTDSAANDWEPKIAVDATGAAHIVWDTYRNGNYDVYLRRFEGGKLGPEVAVADTLKFEAGAGIAADPAGRVWIAWNESGFNWAKDTGPTIDPEWREKRQGEIFRGSGIRIYESRNLNMVVLDGSTRKAPLHDVQAAVSASGGDAHDSPQLFIDGAGRVALIFHRRHQTEPRGERRRRQGYWDTAVMFYQGGVWQPALTLPKSWSRSSARAAAAFSPGGALWAIWPTDGREYANTHRPLVNNVYAARIAPAGKAEAANLKAAALAVAGPENPPIQIAHPNETADLQAIRAYRTFLGEAEHRIVRGDFHRHTELSWDGGGRTDGSLFDFYRYMLDAAAMDFGAVTDHNAGGDNEYWWWLTEKSCDLYHLPGVFTTFYGYERSARFPHGHRNVFHTTRGIPMVSFFTEPSFGGARPGVGSGDLIANDTKLLYESLRRSGGIAISHTSTSDTMGTDWRDNDPEIEPVVEIFKARASRTSTWAAPARRVVRRTSRPAAFRRRALSGTLTPKVTGWARSPAPTTTPPTFPTRWCTQRSRRVKRSLTLSGSVTPTAHGQYYSGLPDGGALHGR